MHIRILIVGGLLLIWAGLAWGQPRQVTLTPAETAILQAEAARRAQSENATLLAIIREGLDLASARQTSQLRRDAHDALERLTPDARQRELERIKELSRP